MGYFMKCLIWLVDIGQGLWWQWVCLWGCWQTLFEMFSVFFPFVVALCQRWWQLRVVAGITIFGWRERVYAKLALGFM